MKVICQATLPCPLEHCEEWPNDLPTLPRVGDYVRSAYVWPSGMQVELVITRVIWVKEKHGWIPAISLELPARWVGFDGTKMQCPFSEWYLKIQGTK